MKTNRPLPESLSLLISSGFYSGLSPVISGTCGSAAALLVWWVLRNYGLIGAWGGEIVGLVLISVVGTVASKHALTCSLRNPERFPRARKPGDPGFIVIDEWAGMWASLIGVPPGKWLLLLVSFALFRLFDIIKPGPVGSAERLPGAYGIMADDIVAGIFVALFMHLGLSWFYEI